jgi:hypothetical protein
MRRSHLWALAAVVLVHIALCAVRIAAVPLWDAHEADFFTATRIVVENGRLPSEADYPAGDADLRQATHPPFIFLAYAPLVAAFDDGTRIPPPLNPAALCPGQPADAAAWVRYAPTPAYDAPTHGAVGAAYAMRALGVVFSVLATLAVFAAARTVFMPHAGHEGDFGGWLAVCAAAAFAWFPDTVEIASIIGNDAPVLLFAALNLWALVHVVRAAAAAGGDAHTDRLAAVPGWALAAIAFAGLATFTKLNGWAVIALTGAVVAGALAWAAGRALVMRRAGGRRIVWGAAAVFAGLAVLVGGLAAFNLNQYGTVFGRYRELDALVSAQLADLAIPGVVWRGVADHTRLSLLEPLASLDARGIVQTAYTALIVGAVALSLAAAVWGAVRRTRWAAGLGVAGATVAIAFVLVVFRSAAIATAANTTDYNTSFVYAPMRYYAQAFPALALLLVGGIGLAGRALITRVMAARVPSVMAPSVMVPSVMVPAVLVIVCAAWVAGEAARVPAVRIVPASVWEAAAPVADARANPAFPHVRAVTIGDVRDGVLTLTVYAQLPAQARDRLFLAEAVWGADRCQFVPGRGAYPPLRWPGSVTTGSVTTGAATTGAVTPDTATTGAVTPDTVTPASSAAADAVAFTVAVPHCTPARPSDGALVLTWYAAEPAPDDLRPSPLTADTPHTVTLGTVPLPATTAPDCPRIHGALGGYRATDYRAPAIVRRGETFLPTVHWLVDAPSSPPPLIRDVVYTHEATGQTYTCESGAGSLPPWAWVRGQTVFFDGCPFVFPADAPTGRYTLALELRGGAAPPGRITVGTVEVQG